MFEINLEPEPPPQAPVVEVVPDAESEGDKSLTPRYSIHLIQFVLSILVCTCFSNSVSHLCLPCQGDGVDKAWF